MKRKLLLITISMMLYAGYCSAADNAAADSSKPEDSAAAKAKEEDLHFQEVVSQAFRAAKAESLLLSKDQIDDFQNRLDETGAAIFPSPPPKMVSRTQNVSLEPGAVPVSVRMSVGYVSSVVVTDSTGEPWPITTATVGNPQLFSVVRPETGANNMLTINALKNHVTSNMAVTIEGRDAPLIIQLTMDSDNANKKPQEADMLVSMRMNKPGPKAAPPVLGAKINSSVSSELMSFLDGVPAPGATIVKLKDAPDGVQAWALKNQLYLRSAYLARWPAWIQQASSSSGVNVYVMPMTSQIILSMNGASHTVTVHEH